MKLKTGILAAVAALSLAVPAAALAQPYYPDYRHQEFRRDGDDWRRLQRERERIRREELRRLQWEREHGRYGYSYSPYR